MELGGTNLVAFHSQEGKVLSCIECSAALIWNKDTKFYIEGQIIKCHLCGSIFNQVFCPQCDYLNIFKGGGFNFGSIVKCNNLECGVLFSQVFCPRCLYLNISSATLETKIIKCRNCHLFYVVVNCLYCNRINIWEGAGYIPGQKIQCAYCMQKYNKILCPNCDLVIPFYNNNFSFGKYYKCIYEMCGKYFKFILCSNCKNVNFLIQTINEFCLLDESAQFSEDFYTFIQCGTCKKNILNLSCPSCENLIVIENHLSLGNTNIELRAPLKFKCPYEKCRETFYLTECFNCRKKYLSINEFPYVENLCLTCSSEYNKNFILFYKRKLNVFKLKTFKKIDKLVCGKTGCHLQNLESDVYGMEFIQGIPFFFDKPEAKKKIIEEKKIIPEQKNSEDEDKNKCVVCFEFDKQALFVPCGHKVCCVGCAKSMFETIKNCCMCHENIEKVIERIYD
jgi:hypothetical protein